MFTTRSEGVTGKGGRVQNKVGSNIKNNDYYRNFYNSQGV